MYKYSYSLLICLLLFSCSDDKSNSNEPKENPVSDSSITQKADTSNTKDYSEQLAFIFEEHQIHQKFIDKLSPEDIRGLLNTQHEELVDTLIYTKDFGLTEAMDVEYFFGKKSKLREVHAICYLNNAAEQQAFYEACNNSLSEIALLEERDTWHIEELNAKIKIQVTGSAKNKNVELRVTKL